MDALFPVEDIMELWKKNSEVAKKMMDEDPESEVHRTSAKANFIATVVARYAVKHSFEPEAFERILNHILSAEYYNETVMRLIENQTGVRPDKHDKDIKDKMRGYQS
jgi:hypothetical protein